MAFNKAPLGPNHLNKRLDEHSKPPAHLGKTFLDASAAASNDSLKSDLRKLRSSLDLVQDCIAYIDSSQKLSFINQAFATLWQLEPTHFSGRSIREAISPRYWSTLESKLELVFAGEKCSFLAQVQAPKTDSQCLVTTLIPDLAPDGAVMGCFLIMNDITEERLILAMEASEMGVWDYLPEHNQLLWSARLQEMYGLKPGTFRGTLEHYQELLHPEDRELVIQTVKDAIAQRKPYTVIHRVTWPDGSVHWIQGKGKPFYDANGALIRITGGSVLIDETKHAETELRQAIESRDEFISIASHELKTPLTSLRLQTEMVKRLSSKDTSTPDAQEKLQKLVEQTDQQITRLSRLIDDMLDVSRINSGNLSLKVETIELRGFLTEVSNHFNPQFEAAGISFHLDAHENFWIDADPYRLEQAIANLYSNAIRYAPGTSLRTTTSWKDGCVEIRVKDKGPGISKEAQNRIFSRFERGDSRSKSLGLGLGLYISKEIIESHQGSIFVESNPGDGATFVVRLPARRD